MQDQDVALWQERLRTMALYWVNKWAWRQDQLPLIEDLIMAGWIAIMERGPDHPRILYEIQNGMQEALSLWLYGVGRRSGKRPRLISKSYVSTPPFRRHEARLEHSVEWTALRRVGLERLWNRLGHTIRRGQSKGQVTTRRYPTQDREVLCLMADSWPARSIYCEARWRRSQHGISDRAMLNGKKRIRQYAAELDLEE